MTRAPASGIWPDPSLTETLKASRQVLIMGHSNPDGDSLGSAVALTLALRSLNVAVFLGYNGRLYQHLTFLLEGLTDYGPIKPEPSEFRPFDLFVLVDCLHPNRIWDGFNNLSALPPRLVIDHHPGDPLKCGAKGVFHDASVSSTGELAFKVIEALNAPLTRTIAEALLAAIMSDTGFFSQNNATPECFRQASVLVAAGARSDYVVGRLKRNWTQSRVRLLRAALGTLEIAPSCHLASMIVTEAMLSETEATLDDMEGFVEYPRSMAGVEVAALFRVDGHGRTRVSLRSGLNYNVRELAEALGGGGHSQAAAYTDPSGDPVEARARFLAVAPRFLKPSS